MADPGSEVDDDDNADVIDEEIHSKHEHHKAVCNTFRNETSLKKELTYTLTGICQRRDQIREHECMEHTSVVKGTIPAVAPQGAFPYIVIGNEIVLKPMDGQELRLVTGHVSALMPNRHVRALMPAG